MAQNPSGRLLFGARSIWIKIFLRRRTAVAAAVALGFLIGVALTANLFTPYGPEMLDIPVRLRPPAIPHLLGTDDFGRDVLSRALFGSRVSLSVGFLVMSCTSLVGSALGLAAGYYRGLDGVIMRLMDGLMAFPGILLAIALLASLGNWIGNVIIALSIVFMPRVARLVRSVVLVVRETQFVEAARALGCSDLHLLVRHIFPSCLSPTIVQGTFIFAYAIIGEAALSFLGVGMPPYIPSWGNMLSEGRLYVQQAPWLTVVPGAWIVITVLSLNLLGDGLRDALDPRFRTM